MKSLYILIGLLLTATLSFANGIANEIKTYGEEFSISTDVDIGEVAQDVILYNAVLVDFGKSAPLEVIVSPYSTIEMNIVANLIEPRARGSDLTESQTMSYKIIQTKAERANKSDADFIIGNKARENVSKV